MSNVILQSLDVNCFIAEVQREPAIWDQSSDENNRTGKKDAWDRICETFCPNFKELNSRQKENISAAFQKKWKNLRDCFNREVKLLKRANQRKITQKKRRYIFFDQLSFLLSPEQKYNITSFAQYKEDAKADPLIGKEDADIDTLVEEDDAEIDALPGEEYLTLEELAQASKDTDQSNCSIVVNVSLSEITTDNTGHKGVEDLLKETIRNNTTNDKRDCLFSGTTNDSIALPSKRIRRQRILFNDELPSDILDNEEFTPPPKRRRQNKKKIAKEPETERLRLDTAEEQSHRVGIPSEHEDKLFCLSLVSNLKRAQTSKDVNQSNCSNFEKDSLSEITADNAAHQRISELSNETKRSPIFMEKIHYSYSEAADNSMAFPSKRIRRKTILVKDELSSEVPENEKVIQTPTKTKQNKMKIDKEGEMKGHRPDITEEQSQRVNIASQDEDTLFCLSLVSNLKKISDNLKCDAKCEILKVLQNYKTYSSNLQENIQESRKIFHQTHPFLRNFIG